MNTATVVRWTARVVGAFFVFIIGMIAVGQGIPNPLAQPMAVQVGLGALALIVAGIVAAWRWELYGGILSLLGWAVFVVMVVTTPRHLNGFAMGLALPGFLYVVSALVERYERAFAAAKNPSSAATSARP